VAVTGLATGYAAISNESAESIEVSSGQFLSAPTPQISGLKNVGRTLTAVTGVWSSGAVLSFEWFRNGVSIDQATSSTYVLDADDQGTTVTVAVTGSAEGYETVTKTSVATSAIAIGTFIQSATPRMVGTFKVGNVLSADEGTWDSVALLDFQWFRNGVAIANATDPEYLLTASDRGKTMSVSVSASAAGYRNLSKTSVKSKVIDYGVYSNTPIPQISGNATIGQTLSAEIGNWDAGVAISYQWKRGGLLIAGATKSTLLLTSKDKGKKISLSVTGKLAGYKTITLNSNLTATVVR
jgi:hypothetical protein